jgi:hypothetical protein
MARAARNANADANVPNLAVPAAVPPQAVQLAVVPVAAAAANPAAAATAAVAPNPQQQPPPIVQPVQQQVPQVQFAVQANPVPVNAFDACLTRLGPMPGAIQYLHAQGFNTEEDFSFGSFYFLRRYAQANLEWSCYASGGVNSLHHPPVPQGVPRLAHVSSNTGTGYKLRPFPK